MLAAGFALGRSAAELRTAMEIHGPQIFPKRIFGGPRRLFGPATYRTEPLREAVSAVLGAQKDALLSDIDASLAVTAVDYSRGTTALFLSAGLAGSSAPRVKLVDAILASAAAPTFFPLLKINQYEFADGGLVANAPDLVALVQALSRQHADLERCYMLSMGTASWSQGVALRDKPGRPGIIGSLWRRRLVQTTMAAQEDLALQQIRVLMRDRHLRIDREADRKQSAQIRSLDNASSNALAALDEIAAEAWHQAMEQQSQAGDHRLRDFFFSVGSPAGDCG